MTRSIALLGLALTLCALPAVAQQNVFNGCVDEVLGFPPSGPNCTANDVSISRATATVIEPCAFVGDEMTISLIANIRLNSGSVRHDIGLYFSTDGGSAGRDESATSPASCEIFNLPFQPPPTAAFDADGEFHCVGGSGDGTVCGATCSGGTRNGLACKKQSECPGGTCIATGSCPGAGVCTGGLQDTCGDLDPANPLLQNLNLGEVTIICRDDRGSCQGVSCDTNSDCQGTLNNGVCTNGFCQGITCSTVSQCPSGDPDAIANTCPNPDGCLDFSSCQTWRQPGDDSLCEDADETIAGSPSKCRCARITPTENGVCIPTPPVCSTDASLAMWDGEFISEGTPGEAYIVVDVPAGAFSVELLPDSDNIEIVDVTDGSGNNSWGCVSTTTCSDPNGDDGQPTQIRVYLRAPGAYTSEFFLRVTDDCDDRRTVDFDPEILLHPATHPTAQSLLEPNYPNPFNPTTRIGYYLAEDAAMRLSIFDVSGRKVRTLAAGQREQGRHESVWNGLNEYGAPVPSGIYIYRLEVNGAVHESRLLTLMR